MRRKRARSWCKTVARWRSRNSRRPTTAAPSAPASTGAATRCAELRRQRAMCRSVLILAFAALGAQAQAPGHAPPPYGTVHYDARYHHNYYYPTHGAYVPALPGTPVVITRGGGRYYYSGGVWYVPSGPRFVVVGAPLGVFVPV